LELNESLKFANLKTIYYPDKTIAFEIGKFIKK